MSSTHTFKVVLSARFVNEVLKYFNLPTLKEEETGFSMDYTTANSINLIGVSLTSTEDYLQYGNLKVVFFCIHSWVQDQRYWAINVNNPEQTSEEIDQLCKDKVLRFC